MITKTGGANGTQTLSILVYRHHQRRHLFFACMEQRKLTRRHVVEPIAPAGFSSWTTLATVRHRSFSKGNDIAVLWNQPCFQAKIVTDNRGNSLDVGEAEDIVKIGHNINKKSLPNREAGENGGGGSRTRVRKSSISPFYVCSLCTNPRNEAQRHSKRSQVIIVLTDLFGNYR